jgi:hypothetical protein
MISRTKKFPSELDMLVPHAKHQTHDRQFRNEDASDEDDGTNEAGSHAESVMAELEEHR